MPLTQNLWYLGAQLMASIQACDLATSRRHLQTILRVIATEPWSRFSHYRLRTLQILTNANRAAFGAGAPGDELGRHTRWIITRLDRVKTWPQLEKLAHDALERTVALVPRQKAYQHRVAREAIDYIRIHYAEAVSRQQLAARLRCSPAHFSRVFSRVTGHSFKDFLQRCRLERAKELLRESHLQVAEIAATVGYQDPFQFSKMFRKREGVSPRQFRESRQAGIMPLRVE
ncbi:MAG: helix-turn-helix transcriptional regulator [Opitutaceae bacterium]|nr:helix-turn-helix transcriptional regulator [Opitutaceae bacterium]